MEQQDRSHDQHESPHQARQGGPTERRHARTAVAVVRWLAIIALPAAVIGAVVVNLWGKHGVDVYPPAVALWLVASFQAIRWTHTPRSYVVATAALLLADALAEVVAMGSWLHGPWSLANEMARAIVGQPFIVEWRWDLGAGVLLPWYWLAFWTVAVPLRTVALITGVLLGAERWGRWLMAPLCLAAATFALYVSRVQDVISYTLLGYLPLLTRTPLDFSYLPPVLGFAWDTPSVALMAGSGLAIAVVLFDVALAVDAADERRRAAFEHEPPDTQGRRS